MDPITQGALGAAASLSAPRPRRLSVAFMAGWLGGMAADLDVLIRAEDDPIFFLEFHRHFTHSLIFIPAGGLLVAGFLWLVWLRKLASFKEVYFAATIGYATHGLLDACTSYGTLLWWPFSMERVAWNSIAIIDPLVTLPLLISGLATLISGRQRWNRAALAFVLAYLSAGFFIRDFARDEAARLAASRGHEPVRLEAKPTVLNLVLWRTIYEHGGRFYIDAVWWTPWRAKVYPGGSVEKVDRVPETWPAGSRLARDFDRFRWFSNDYLAWHPEEEGVLGDVRYSTIPNRISPLWGIRAVAPERHVDYVVARKISDGDFAIFFKMMIGRD